MNFTSEMPSLMFGPPTALDIVLPPVIFIVFILISTFLLSLLTQPRWWQNRCGLRSSLDLQIPGDIAVNPTHPPCKPGWCDMTDSTGLTEKHQHPLTDSNPYPKHGQQPIEDSFFTKEDRIILNKIEEYQNNPLSLIIICIPVLASLAFCPVTILTYGMWMKFFWPPEITGGMTNINDAIACFLMPAGLVYAIAFGFAFQDVLAKKAEVEKCLNEQMNLLRQTKHLLICADIFNEELRLNVAVNMKEAIISWMAKIPGVKRIHSRGNLWDALTALQEHQFAKTESDGTGNRKRVLENTIIKSLCKNLLQLDNSLAEGCRKGNRSINSLQWLFLELLGFISFFGILMVKAGSYRLELTMCILTVFSISVFSYILADLDNSYHGVFRISLKPHIEFVKNLNANLIPKKSKLQKH